MVTNMILHVPDETLRAISFDDPPRGDSLTIGRPRGPLAARPLFGLLYCFSWRDVRRTAECAVERTGLGYNDSGFRYPSDLDPCEESFEGVNVYDPLDDILVSLPAFEEVMSRFFRALIAGAEKHGDPVRSEPWWPEFVRLAEELAARVAKEAQGLSR